MLQDVGTMKSLHWSYEVWVGCVERKRSAKLPWSATAPCTFAAAPSFQACLRAFHMYILNCVCVHICVCVYVCGHVYMYVYACVYVFVHPCVYTHVYVYVYVYLCIDCRSWYQYFSVWTVSYMCMCFVFVCIMCIHMYVGIYICAFFCSECYMHFTGVLGTSAWAGEYITWVCFYTNIHICEHTCCRFTHMCICIYVCICMRMHMDAYVCL